jgi:hypothetical protein
MEPWQKEAEKQIRDLCDCLFLLVLWDMGGWLQLVPWFQEVLSRLEMVKRRKHFSWGRIRILALKQCIYQTREELMLKTNMLYLYSRVRWVFLARGAGNLSWKRLREAGSCFRRKELLVTIMTVLSGHSSKCRLSWRWGWHFALKSLEEVKGCSSSLSSDGLKPGGQAAFFCWCLGQNCGSRFSTLKALDLGGVKIWAMPVWDYHWTKELWSHMT